MKGPSVITRARDSRGNEIEPRCIKYYHDAVLEVVVGDVFSLGAEGFASASSISRSATPDTDGAWTMEAPGEHELGESIAVLASSESSAIASPLPGVGRTDLTDDVVPSLPTQRQVATQDSGTMDLSDNIISIADLPINSTSISRADRPGSSRQTTQVIQQIQSTVQTFEQLMVKGKNEQALVTKQESELIRQELAQLFSNLQAEIAKNMALQYEVMNMVEAGEQKTNKILELQEAQMERDKQMGDFQRQALDRLAFLQSSATAIVTQTNELNEYQIPRLFVILPRDGSTDLEKITSPFVQRFRLYFLCECGEHTRPVKGASSTISHDIHISDHKGYDLDRPNEFFQKYGSYMHSLLKVLHYALLVESTGGRISPPPNIQKIANGFENGFEDLLPRVDSSIEYLKRLTEAAVGNPEDIRTVHSRHTVTDSGSFNRLKSLERPDLRQLEKFLKVADKGKALGNLYRITTSEGHIKWVCLAHYRESYNRSTALWELNEIVELNRGTLDHKAGRVTIRLATPLLATQFYSKLLLVKAISKLELVLDWNTTFEDLRALKDAIQQSTISHLRLDLRSNTGPTSNFIYRNRRAEPIVHIMASPKIHSIKLRNTTGFLSQAKDLLKFTLHVRHFDLNETVATAEDVGKLEKLIRASPMLARLSVVVGDMDDSFDRLRPFVAQHRSLSTLDLRLQDGTAASVKFEDGLSNNIKAIQLKITEPKSFRLMKMPMVTSVEFLTKHSSSKSVELVQSAIKEHKLLQEIRIVHLPDGGSEVLRDLQRAIHYYCSGWNANVGSAQDGDLSGSIDSSAFPKPRDRFMELESLQKRSVLPSAELLIATTEGVKKSGNALKETTEEISGKTEEISGMTETVGVDNHNTTSAFSFPRQDGSLAMVRYKHERDGSHAAVLDVGDFDISRVVQCSSVTRLMLFGERGAILFNHLIEAPATGGFVKLKTLEFDCKPGKMLGFLQVGLLARAQCPALSILNLWNTNNTAMEKFGIPPSRTLIIYNLLLRTMDFGDYFVSQEEISNLRKLFRGTPLLSELKLSVSSDALTDPTFALTTRVGLGERVTVDFGGMAQPPSSGESHAMQWVMSNTADTTPVDFYAHSVYSDETSGVHFRRLAVRTESEASMIMGEDGEDEELIRRRITDARDLSTIEE
ncbi:hypothetical protein BGX30_011835 [Mortierella sp. GBA39]|nr:hypothetical protein BGX30_011835 [Mortierella sp. GBA39]